MVLNVEVLCVTHFTHFESVHLTEGRAGPVQAAQGGRGGRSAVLAVTTRVHKQSHTAHLYINTHGRGSARGVA